LNKKAEIYDKRMTKRGDRILGFCKIFTYKGFVKNSFFFLDLMFSRRWLWRKPSSWMWLRIDIVLTDVPPKHRLIQYLHGATSKKTAFFMIFFLILREWHSGVRYCKPCTSRKRLGTSVCWQVAGWTVTIRS
jgi:hypothetical protein